MREIKQKGGDNHLLVPFPRWCLGPSRVPFDAPTTLLLSLQSHPPTDPCPVVV